MWIEEPFHVRHGPVDLNVTGKFIDMASDSTLHPWTSGRPNQSILKEINPEYSLEGLMLKLKLQYFDHVM